MEASTLNISNSKPPLNSEESLPFLIVGDEAFPLNQYLLRPYPGVSARNDESKHIYKYILTRARRAVENAFVVLTQKVGLFYGRTQLSPENAGKVALPACILHSYLGNDVNVEDRVIETQTLYHSSRTSQHFAVPVEVLVKKPCVQGNIDIALKMLGQ